MNILIIQYLLNLLNNFMDNTETVFKIGLIVVASYVMSHLIYRLALEVWCVAYGIIY